MATADPFRGVEVETVRVLRGTVQALLKSENDRAGSFLNRGSGLTGFVGLALPLAIAVASRAPTNGWSRYLAFGLTAAAALCFLAAVTVSLLEVLLPSPGITIDLDEVRRYPTYEFIRKPPLEVEGRFLRGEVESLAVERRRNDRKGRSLRYAYIALTAGLVFVAGEGILLVASRA
jgi:hypothetical protein